MDSKIIKNVNGLDISILTSSYKKTNERRDNILLLHGFPELGYSFRYLIDTLSSSGYYCIAPDQRGYGNTKFKNYKEKRLKQFSVLNLAKDMYLLLKKIKVDKIDIIGHDFGAYVACYFSLLYPKAVKSIIIMSMPFSGPPSNRGKEKINFKDLNIGLKKLNPKRKHYQSYFCSPNASRNMLNCNQGVYDFLRGYYYFKSHNYKNNKPFRLKNSSPKELSKLPEYYIMKRSLGMAQTIKSYMPSNKKLLLQTKAWMTDKDLSYYAKQFEKGGFKEPLKWYRMMLSSKEKENIKKLKLQNYLSIPGLFISGESDWGMYQKPGELEKMQKSFFKKFYGVKIVKNAGHWVQQENPQNTSNYILNFYNEL